jgi:5-formyltetrahydrofolate cyclo-ligase
MDEAKAKLREKLKQARQQLSPDDRVFFSQTICEKLEKLDWSDVSTVHFYEPIKELVEVDIMPFINKIRLRYPDIKLYTWAKVDKLWKIVSWHGGSISSPLYFDAIIVPILGFDTYMHRIGYGGGYYDRFLTNQIEAKKIGVSFEMGKTEKIPADSHDIKVDRVISEKSMYR